MADFVMLQAALSYAARGWRCFPLHVPLQDGGCSCGSSPCRDAGKHPRIKAWQEHATTDPAQITRWWSRWPTANIGLAAGAGSGIVVIDVDGDEGREHGWVRDLPPTVAVITGSGGAHYLFQHPGEPVGNRQAIAAGIDVRGDGGYIVATPSLHPSGRRYEWEASGHPDDLALAPLPDWLRERLTRRKLP